MSPPIQSNDVRKHIFPEHLTRYAKGQGNGGIGTGTPKYHAVAAASTPTTGAAATKPPYLDKPCQ